MGFRVPLAMSVGVPETPKVCKIIAFWCCLEDFGLLFYLLLGPRYIVGSRLLLYRACSFKQAERINGLRTSTAAWAGVL